MKRILSVSMAALFLSIGTLLADELPQTTADGLNLIDSKNVQALYWRDGATLEEYSKVKILDCFVAFEKNWQRDYNRSSLSPSERVDARDMERIKATLAEEFNDKFTENLERAGYEVVEETGHDVLLLRPALVNLQVTAPDLKTPNRGNSFTASAGQMSLVMELYDSATSAKIGLVMDAQAARDTGFVQISNSVTNKVEADRILNKWAGLLVAGLDRAHGK